MRIYECTEISENVLEAFKTLVPQLCSDCSIPSIGSLKQIVESQNSHLFFAKDNNQIVGSLTLIIYQIPTGEKAWIEDVVVDARERGKGIGKNLINYAVDFCKSKGISRIDLTSRPERTEANSLYKKLGFVKRETNVYRLNV